MEEKASSQGLEVEKQDNGTGLGTERAWESGESNRYLLNTYYVPCAGLEGPPHNLWVDRHNNPFR